MLLHLGVGLCSELAWATPGYMHGYNRMYRIAKPKADVKGKCHGSDLFMKNNAPPPSSSSLFLVGPPIHCTAGDSSSEFSWPAKACE